MLTPPRDPIAAVTHPDPYGYYADLVARAPCYRDERLAMWIAASADAASAVLISERCRVRPPAEPVPLALLGTPAATIFQRLVRMSDGRHHPPARRAVARTLSAIPEDHLVAWSHAWARRLGGASLPEADPTQIAPFAFDLSVYVIASLLGVPDDQLARVAVWMRAFARCIAPGGSAAQVAQGIGVSGQLFDLFRELLAAGHGEGPLMRHAREAGRAGLDDDMIVANAIGFLSQAYEATAGLIGNTLLALGARREVREHVPAEPGLLRQVMREVLRHDPPVHNTRRFLARDGMVAGQEMRAGDMVLVVLAAANRDPSANPHPERFDILRPDRRSYTFGIGAHACVGEALALAIAGAAIEELLRRDWDYARLVATVTYRASANTRIPLWAAEQDGMSR
jgi:cytochrome P450